MKVKRFLSGLLAAALLLCAVPAAYAAQEPTVKLSSGTAEPGGTVTLTVSMENNPGLAACILYFYYDTSVFTVDPRKGIRASGDFREDGGVIGNSIELAKENGRYYGDASKDGALAYWYNSSGLDTNANGAMLTIKLTVAADASPGEYEVGMDCSSIDTVNEKKSTVPLNLVSGSVTVKSSVEDAGSIPPVLPQDGEYDEPEPEVELFTDISGHWAESYIERAAEIGLVNGMGNNKFEPDSTMTRAQMVTVLWRMLGEPKASAPASFTDLKQDWYKEAVAWAEENNVVNGVGGGKFDPTGAVTREQVVTILHRLMGAPTGMEKLFASTYDSYYTDSALIRSWAKDAVYWAVYEEIYCGETSVAIGRNLAPRNQATRAQIMVMIVRYLDNR